MLVRDQALTKRTQHRRAVLFYTRIQFCHRHTDTHQYNTRSVMVTFDIWMYLNRATAIFNNKKNSNEMKPGKSLVWCTQYYRCRGTRKAGMLLFLIWLVGLLPLYEQRSAGESSPFTQALPHWSVSSECPKHSMSSTALYAVFIAAWCQQRGLNILEG